MSGQPVAALVLALAPQFGCVTINPDGSFTYTPIIAELGQSATDTFEYVVSDGEGGTIINTVRLNLT